MNYAEFNALPNESYVSSTDFASALADMIATTPIVYECVDRHGNGCNKLFKMLEDKRHSKLGTQ